MKLYRKPTDCMTLLHFHSHHPLSCKEGIIYSQALLNMIISKNHILKEQCNNLTGILIARTNPLHVIIKKIKKALTNSRNYLLSQQTPHIETDILPIITPFSEWANNWQPSYTEIATLLPMTPHSPLFGHPNLYQPIANPRVFITTLFTLHKHMVPDSKTPRTTTHTHPRTPIRTYPQWYTHDDITAVVTPLSASIPDTPNSS